MILRNIYDFSDVFMNKNIHQKNKNEKSLRQDVPVPPTENDTNFFFFHNFHFNITEILLKFRIYE